MLLCVLCYRPLLPDSARSQVNLPIARPFGLMLVAPLKLCMQPSQLSLQAHVPDLCHRAYVHGLANLQYLL